MNPQNRGPQDPNQQKRMMTAIVMSLLILFGYHYFVEQPRIEALKAERAALETADIQAQLSETPADIDAAVNAAPTVLDHATAIAQTPRLEIENDFVEGSLSLTGNRIDDLQLKGYAETLENNDSVTLFAPSATERPYYAEFGFIAENKSTPVPSETTQWQRVSGETLGANAPVILRWDNGQGLVFERKITLDEHYLFTVTERVLNQSAAAVTLYPYQLLSRKGLPKDYLKLFILHQGPISFSDNELEELSYGDLDEVQKFEAKDGWAGFTDKYWFTSIIPEQGKTYKSRFFQSNVDEKDIPRYQIDLLGEAMTVLPQSASETTFRVFAGAKKLEIMEGYKNQSGLKNIDLAIDFGIWSIITKPLYLALNFLSESFGHVAWGIIVLTVLIRLVMFPLNNKSFRSMAAMKKIAPKLKEIQEAHKGDTKAMQMKIMELYQKEKVNPLSGCWPILFQIPIFFALYKVIMLDIDMRHAPFPGWIKDMSEMDPTSIFNLFGLLPYEVSGFFVIGAWPCLMGFTMYLQRRLNPPPTDPMQAKIMAYMPFFFVVILGKFAAGLVIYWAWSNFLGLLQQYTIMRRMGVDVSLIKGYKKKPVDENQEDTPEEKNGADKAEKKAKQDD